VPDPGTRQAGARAVGNSAGLATLPRTRPVRRSCIRPCFCWTKTRNFNAVLRPVLLRRTGRSVIDRPRGGGKGRLGWPRPGWWLSALSGDANASALAPGRGPPGAGQVTLAGRMVWIGTTPTSSPVDELINGRGSFSAGVGTALCKRDPGPTISTTVQATTVPASLKRRGDRAFHRHHFRLSPS
jgi:hypothetical protein